MLGIPDGGPKKVAERQVAKTTAHGLDAGHKSGNEGLATLVAAQSRFEGLAASVATLGVRHRFIQHRYLTYGDGPWIGLLEIRIITRIHRIDLMLLGIVIEHRENAKKHKVYSMDAGYNSYL